MAKGDEILGGKIQHLARRRRPDRGPHRREIIAEQPRDKMTGSETVAEREPGEFARGVVLDALLVEESGCRAASTGRRVTAN